MASNMDFLSKIRAQAASKENQNGNVASKDSGSAPADGKTEGQSDVTVGSTDRQTTRPDSDEQIQDGTGTPEAAPKAGVRLGFLAQAGRMASAPQLPAAVEAAQPVDAGESAAPDQGSVDAIAAQGGGALAVLDHSNAGLADSSQAPGPENFQQRLDELDKLCRAESGITEFTHDAVKSRVRMLMLDLQSNPEMENLIIDRDVHNIMAFIQAAARSADSKFEVKAVKKEKTANNKSKTAAKASLFAGAFADMLSDVDMLASMNTDGIETKNRK